MGWMDNANNETGYRVMAGDKPSGDLRRYDELRLACRRIHVKRRFVQAFNISGTSDSERHSAIRWQSRLWACRQGVAQRHGARSLNGNPAPTVAEVERSTDNASFYSIRDWTSLTIGLVGAYDLLLPGAPPQRDGSQRHASSLKIHLRPQVLPTSHLSRFHWRAADSPLTGSSPSRTCAYNLYYDPPGAINYASTLAVLTLH